MSYESKTNYLFLQFDKTDLTSELNSCHQQSVVLKFDEVLVETKEEWGGGGGGGAMKLYSRLVVANSGYAKTVEAGLHVEIKPDVTRRISGEISQD